MGEAGCRARGRRGGEKIGDRRPRTTVSPTAPGRILGRDVSYESFDGIHWKEPTEEKIEAIPLLRRLRRERDGDDAD